MPTRPTSDCWLLRELDHAHSGVLAGEVEPLAAARYLLGECDALEKDGATPQTVELVRWSAGRFAVRAELERLRALAADGLEDDQARDEARRKIEIRLAENAVSSPAWVV